jgi:hypothetical protein
MWLHDWQTLVTGLLALLAAYIAARPVWRQIRSLQIQSAVTERETLTIRIDAIESRRDTTRKRIVSITSEFLRKIYPYEGAELDINIEWAVQAVHLVDEVVAAFAVLQETSLDGELIDTKRRAAIQQAKQLSVCLSEVHTPYSGILDDPELNLVQEDIAAATTAAARAEANLRQRISSVIKSGDELDAAFKTTLGRLRDRIRQIDEDIIVVRKLGTKARIHFWLCSRLGRRPE